MKLLTQEVSFEAGIATAASILNGPLGIPPTTFHCA